MVSVNYTHTENETKNAQKYFHIWLQSCKLKCFLSTIVAWPLPSLYYTLLTIVLAFFTIWQPQLSLHRNFGDLIRLVFHYNAMRNREKKILQTVSDMIWLPQNHYCADCESVHIYLYALKKCNNWAKNRKACNFTSVIS